MSQPIHVGVPAHEHGRVLLRVAQHDGVRLRSLVAELTREAGKVVAKKVGGDDIEGWLPAAQKSLDDGRTWECFYEAESWLDANPDER